MKKCLVRKDIICSLERSSLSHMGNGGFALLQTLSLLFTLMNSFGSH